MGWVLNVQVPEEDRSTPLHLASRRGHTELADMLLEHGADVSAHNDPGLTQPLLASRSRNMEGIRIQHAADATAVRDRDEDVSTVLHLALQWGRAAVACVLFERGADLMASGNE